MSSIRYLQEQVAKYNRIKADVTREYGRNQANFEAQIADLDSKINALVAKIDDITQNESAEESMI